MGRSQIKCIKRCFLSFWHILESHFLFQSVLVSEGLGYRSQGSWDSRARLRRDPAVGQPTRLVALEEAELPLNLVKTLQKCGPDSGL